jgi:hypothetical protein
VALSSSPVAPSHLRSKAKEDELGGTCSTNGKIIKPHNILFGTSEAWRAVWVCGHEYRDNDKLDLVKGGLVFVEWIRLAQEGDLR